MNENVEVALRNNIYKEKFPKVSLLLRILYISGYVLGYIYLVSTYMKIYVHQDINMSRCTLDQDICLLSGHTLHEDINISG